MIEMLEYKDVPNSPFGFQWTVIGEADDEKEAKLRIVLILLDYPDKDRSNFNTRQKRIITGIAPDNRFDKHITHTERRKRWDQGNPVGDFTTGEKAR